MKRFHVSNGLAVYLCGVDIGSFHIGFCLGMVGHLHFGRIQLFGIRQAAGFALEVG